MNNDNDTHKKNNDIQIHKDPSSAPLIGEKSS